MATALGLSTRQPELWLLEMLRLLPSRLASTPRSGLALPWQRPSADLVQASALLWVSPRVCPLLRQRVRLALPRLLAMFSTLETEVGLVIPMSRRSSV